MAPRAPQSTSLSQGVDRSCSSRALEMHIRESALVITLCDSMDKQELFFVLALLKTQCVVPSCMLVDVGSGVSHHTVILFFFNYILGSIVDLLCCVSFRCTEK